MWLRLFSSVVAAILIAEICAAQPPTASVVPPNTTATVEFPDGQESQTLVAGKYQFTFNFTKTHVSN